MPPRITTGSLPEQVEQNQQGTGTAKFTWKREVVVVTVSEANIKTQVNFLNQIILKLQIHPS